jgi:hypothetical protein
VGGSLGAEPGRAIHAVKWNEEREEREERGKMPKGKKLKLSERMLPSVKAEIAAELAPLFAPYFEHQGWPSLETADTASEVLVDLFREMGVMIPDRQE